MSNKVNSGIRKFDLIVSNPPQLPIQGGTLHDSGGEDGRNIIDHIIVGARGHLNLKGSIIILVFDFLSVDKKYGEREKIFDLLKNDGFTPSIIGEVERILNPTGKTFEALKDIQKYYPEYNFREDKLGNKFYKMRVVKGDLT
jgi:methylase of polypeptide subunit release factors